jgi:hypothetical protein
MDNLYLHHKKLWCIVTRIRCVVRSTECVKPSFISGTVSHLFQLNLREYDGFRKLYNLRGFDIMLGRF